MPDELREAIEAFIEYYNYRRYQAGLSYVMPYDVYMGRYLEILQRRKEVKSKTLATRRNDNKTAREQGHGL
jgi:hypothetical protein